MKWRPWPCHGNNPVESVILWFVSGLFVLCFTALAISLAASALMRPDVLNVRYCVKIVATHFALPFWTKANVSARYLNKAVLEPRVSPAFAITYFCNHCNIRFENTSLKYVDTLTLFSKNLNQRSLTPRWPLTPCLLRSHVWLYPRIIVSKSHGNTSIDVCGYSDQLPHT